MESLVDLMRADEGKVTVKDLLSLSLELTVLADKCRRLGLISDMQVECRIDDGGNSYNIGVSVDKYLSTKKSWEAKKYAYGDDKEPHMDLEDADGLWQHLNGLLDKKDAEVRSALEILNE